MRIRFDNVNFNASNGPNGFALKLAKEFIKNNHIIDFENPDVQLSFIQKNNNFNPTVLRLDGIYFNTEQNWKEQNKLIYESYLSSQSVIVQSNFNKELIFNYFGKKENVYVVNNGTDIDEIKNIPEIQNNFIDEYENVWMCASHWRPHKRLNENIEYFLENKNDKDCLIIAGKGFTENINSKYQNHEDIFYIGEVNWYQLISCMKKAKYFIHLSFLDHCPNVVVDAKACNCKVIVSSSGGTKELCDKNDVIIKDLSWDFKPLKLYKPPKLNYSDKIVNDLDNPIINIKDISEKYLEILKRR